MDTGLWHYNMGTVHAEMNNWPMARYHFLLADEAGFSSKELRQNQEMAESKLEVPRLEQPLATSDYLVKTAMVANQGPLMTLGLIFLIIGLWLLKKKPRFKSAVVFVIAVATPLLIDLWIDAWPKKIVTVTKAVYEGPSALFEIRGEIPAGVLVLTNTKGEWEEIIFPSRFSGWIKSDGLKRLELK